MNTSNELIPPTFYKIMKDFTNDILITFPEYKEKLDLGLTDVLNGDNNTENVLKLFEYVKNVYPERFFDILYQNESIFTDNEINTVFLPNIDFSHLWKQDISDNTKTIIWKYLQLILFTTINGESNGQSFGETAKLFEAINEGELKKKLEETMEQMNDIFDMSNNENLFGHDVSNINVDDLPNPEDLHSHINDMLKGNLGKLAAEITEETMQDFNTDISGVDSVGDIFQNLFKNPGKLMNMIKKVGDKLDNKLKSGELKESELMKEAMDLMEKMEKMPGMKNMKNMMSQMGMPNMGNNKMNTGAMSGQLKQNFKSAKQKERMLKKLEQRRAVRKDDQLKILQDQLADVRKNNSMQADSNVQLEQKNKCKKKRRNRKNKNK